MEKEKVHNQSIRNESNGNAHLIQMARALPNASNLESEGEESGKSMPAPNYVLDTPMPPEDNPIQRKETNDSSSEGKSGMESPNKSNVLDYMGQKFNQDFSTVQLHTDSSSAENLNAQAYAQGNDIHFAPGKFSPNTAEGQSLIGHELQHVVQRREGRVEANNTIQGFQLNDDPALEKEADDVGKKIAFGGTSSSLASGADSSNTIQAKVIQRHPGHGDHEERRQPVSGQGSTTGGSNSAGGQTENQEGQNTARTGFGGILDQAELALFNMRDTWGPQTMVPPVFNDVMFEATYNRPGKSLFVEVRGKTSFINGLSGGGSSVSSNQSDLDQLTNILNILGNDALSASVVATYTWTDEGKVAAKEQYKQRLAESMGIWSDNGMEFYINKPGWEDITARLNVNLVVEEEGTLGDSASRDAAGQHLQVNVYKTPTAEERRVIRQELNLAITQYEQDNQVSIGNIGSLDVGAFVDGTANTNQNTMNLSSNDLEASQSNEDFSHLSTKVFFEHNSATLSPSSIARLQNFISGFANNGDANAENNKITLIGNTSSSGTDEYNRALAQRRIDSVRAVLAGEGVSQFNERMNENNQGETAHGGNPEGNEAYYRSVDVKIGSGERQNTIAHEFGHVFGLADEYEKGSQPAGNASGHDQLSRDMGTGPALVENNDGIISTGNEVRAQHLSPFVWTLRELTGKTWLVRNQG